jgi:O6-methylguanine-DNA--protein-cysteine methyltransferase
MIHYRTIDSPIGPLALAGHGRVLTNLRLIDQTHQPSRTDWVPDDQAFPNAVDQLNAYFAGERTHFDLELSLAGSDFQRRVWQALLAIPYGETRSYGQIAEQDRRVRRRSGRRIGKWPQSDRHYRPLPPRNRCKWEPYRLRRRPRPKTGAARIGETPASGEFDAF